MDLSKLTKEDFQNIETQAQTKIGDFMCYQENRPIVSMLTSLGSLLCDIRDRLPEPVAPRIERTAIKESEQLSVDPALRKSKPTPQKKAAPVKKKVSPVKRKGSKR